MPVTPAAYNGQLLFSIQAAAAQHPVSPRPSNRQAPSSEWQSIAKVRNDSWDHVRMQTPVPRRQSTRPPVSLPKPVTKPVVKPTPTSVSGRVAPLFTSRWTASPGASAPSSSPGLWESMTGWIKRHTGGAYETVRYGLPFVGGRNDGFLQGKQSAAVSIARQEWLIGSRERGSSNTGKRVDLYAKTAKMNTGQEWCGFFVGYAYRQNGFKKPEMMASGYKAQLFFLNRTMNGQDPDRLTHRSQGQGRQYFLLPESPGRKFIKNHAGDVPDFKLAANTYTWDQLPVRAGDTILFERRTQTGIPDHVGIVESYDRLSGRLVTVEGNVNHQVVRKTYDLKDSRVRRTISGIGRPAPGDFV
jgi:hypothetical protein